jgi:hypothetical protein
VVEAGRRAALPRHARDLHHRRRGRQQWSSSAAAEGRAATACRRDPHRDLRESLSAGHSKWNKIEHRLFSFISINWRGRPLRTYETIINLISNTTNRVGLVVRARLDRRRYSTSKKISAKEFQALQIEPDAVHGDWNYVVRPRAKEP